jgi:transposase
MCEAKFESHLGIDLHKTTLTLASRDPEKRVQKVQSIDTKCVDKIVKAISELPRPIICAIESVGMYEWLWELLEDKVDKLVLADAAEVKRMRKRGEAKTDKNDALLLARLLVIDEVPTAYVPNKTFRTLRKLGRHYHRVSQMLSDIKVQMRWCLNQKNARGPKSLNSASAQRWLLAHGYRLDSSSLFAYKQQLGMMERLETDKIAIVREMMLIAKDKRFERDMKLIQSVTGIGPVIGFIIHAEIADFTRFPSGDAIACYTGLTTRTCESAGKAKQGHISKCGNPTLRWALVEAATTLIQHDQKYKRMHQRIVMNKGSDNSVNRQIAKVAIAQKLVRYLRKMIITGEEFRKGEPTNRQAKLNQARLEKKVA